MTEGSGVFIVLEGADGSGKMTQFKLLAARMKAVGYDVEAFDFPRYEEPSSHFIKSYLNGEYGPADKVSPYTASLFYALDRFEAAPAIRQALHQGKVVLSNRYVGSNMAHQGSKLDEAVQKRGFFVWADSLEYQLMGIPRPTINIFLSVPAEISYKLIAQKSQRNYTNKSHDQHEADIEHLRKTISTYELLCQLFPKDFKPIETTKNNQLLPIAEISDRIWENVKPLLPPKPPNRARGVTLNLDSLTAEAAKPVDRRSQPGDNQSLAQSSTDQIIKLSKISLLAESYIALEKDVSSKVDLLGWPGDIKTYYKPSRLPVRVNKIYQDGLNKLADNYQIIERGLKNYKHTTAVAQVDEALKKILPLAVLCNAEIKGSPQALSRLAQRLLSTRLEELVWCAKQIEIALAEKTNSGNEMRDEISDISSTIGRHNDDHVTRLVRQHLPGGLADEPDHVSLLEAWPRNELELLIDTIYPLSNLARPTIEQTVDGWKYDDKKAALLDSFKRPGSLILEQVHYKYDVVADQPQLSQLIKIVATESLQLQKQTPRYGYETPQLIEAASLDDIYDDCFDQSLRLFSSLQAAGLEFYAPYATLLGHKLRCEFIVNGQGLLAALHLRSRTKLLLLDEMIERLSEIHPLIADSLLSPSKKLAKPTKKSTKAPNQPRRRSVTRRKKK